MRVAHRNANIYVKDSGIEYTMKEVEIDNDTPFPPYTLKYPAVKLQGLFEQTLYPEHIDMTEAKESGRIQLWNTT